MKYASNHQRGISLLEVMLSLAIIGLILAMAARYFNIVTGDSQFNQAIAFVNEIKQGTAKCSAFGGGCDPAKTTLAQLYNYGYISQQTSNLLNNPWGGTFSLTGGTLRLGSVPTRYCLRLKAQFPGSTCTAGPGASDFELDVTQ